jgi:FkbM family methyltransferase
MCSRKTLALGQIGCRRMLSIKFDNHYMPTTKTILRNLIPPIFVQAWRSLSFCKQDLPLSKTVNYDRLGSYSQFQEDLIIDALLGYPHDGIYIDVGANHPVTLNNTYRFYKRGWRGISVEPNPALHARLAEVRPCDKNLNIGIAPKKKMETFYITDPDTLSSFDRKTSMREARRYGGGIVSELQIECLPLTELFAIAAKEHSGKTVVLLSVDCEGYDLEVLRSLDWKIYRPSVVLVEINQGGSKIEELLRGVGYQLVFCNGTNGIFSST